MVLEKKTDCGQIPLWKIVAVLKGLFLGNSQFERVWWSLNVFTSSILGGCGGLERADFQ